MKFLCGNCKAKYQIADEKISGRTLRMKCRRCTHDIIIRGDSVSIAPGPAPAPPPAAAPRKTTSSSHLGADFRRQVATAAPEPPPPPPEPLDQWHVAINDVPVGPVRKAEIQRKVAAGAVNGDSLCWREGFDDWRPLREVPELATLLRQPPPPPPRPAAVGRGIRRREGSRPRMRIGSRSTAPAAPGSSPTPQAPSGPPSGAPAPSTGRSNVVPIGGRLGAAAAPAFEPEADLLPEEPTRVSEPSFMEPDRAGSPRAAPVAPPRPIEPLLSAIPDPFASSRPPAAAAPLAAPAAAEAGRASSDPFFGVASPGGSVAPSREPSVADFRPRRRGLPVGAWIAIAGAIAFGMTFAVMLGIKFVFTEPPVEVAVNDMTDPVAEPHLPELRTPEEEPLVIPEDIAPEDVPSEELVAGADRTVRPTMSTATTMQTASTSMLSAEDRARLERFGAGGGASPTAIAVGAGGMDSSSSSSGPGLNADQLSRVVTNNRPSLRRCYETAIRGMGDPPTVRVNVNLTVGTSGRVSRVNATATNQLPGLTMCVQNAVRTWIFPSSGNSTVTQFPLVFTGAG